MLRSRDRLKYQDEIKYHQLIDRDDAHHFGSKLNTSEGVNTVSYILRAYSFLSYFLLCFDSQYIAFQHSFIPIPPANTSNLLNICSALQGNNYSSHPMQLSHSGR